MLKVKVTKPGINFNAGDGDGERELSIGELIKLPIKDKSELPASFVNKCIVVGESDGKELNTGDTELLNTTIEENSKLAQANKKLLEDLGKAKSDIDASRAELDQKITLIADAQRNGERLTEQGDKLAQENEKLSARIAELEEAAKHDKKAGK